MRGASMTMTIEDITRPFSRYRRPLPVFSWFMHISARFPPLKIPNTHPSAHRYHLPSISLIPVQAHDLPHLALVSCVTHVHPALRSIASRLLDPIVLYDVNCAPESARPLSLSFCLLLPPVDILQFSSTLSIAHLPSYSSQSIFLILSR